jgi:type I restriction enzyme R subunit
LGLNPDEVAFYGALADDRSAVGALGNDQLKITAHKLLTASGPA